MTGLARTGTATLNKKLDVIVILEGYFQVRLEDSSVQDIPLPFFTVHATFNKEPANAFHHQANNHNNTNNYTCLSMSLTLTSLFTVGRLT